MQRNFWVDRLRAFLTVLVVAHHSSLAYTSFAKFDSGTYINSTAPVVDESRWIVLDIFENFNDIFFMSLMFFISGLFVVNSITRKGQGNFLLDRFKRLGIPFILGVCLIIPIAYIPSYYLVNHEFSVIPFIRDFLFHQQWPVGPPWFIWVLLAFNVVSVCIPLVVYRKISALLSRIAKRPLVFILMAYIFIALTYIPLSIELGASKWTGWWPFDFQLNRIFLYFLVFIVGTIMGSADWNNYLFNDKKLLNGHWAIWLIFCVLFYLIVEVLSYFGKQILSATGLTQSSGYLIYQLFYVGSCLASCLFFVAYFRANQNYKTWIWTSLSGNAFGIYLVHYVFVTWIQFLLVDRSLPVGIKFMLVFLGSLFASWALIIWLRKSKAIARII